MIQKGTTEPPKKPRRRATLLQAQARRMSKRLSIEFGLALRDARLRASLSQRDVAKRARVRRTYISRVELGEQNLTLATMVRLARAVGLGVSLAITDDDPTPPATLLSISLSGPSPADRRRLA
jgi:transcriptional regulator with XRE-family HTH domain